MEFEEGDRVIIRERFSDHDGETGRITSVLTTMFGDTRYVVEFEDGVETGVPGDKLVPSDSRPGEMGPCIELFRVRFESCSLN